MPDFLDFINSYDSYKKNQNYAFNNNAINPDFELFNFLGFKLHLDDLIILGLLLFLYEEQVTDMYLYVALILLLLS